MVQKRQSTIDQEHFRSRGAVLSLQQLLDQRFTARLLELDYQNRTRLGMTGTHVSRIKGRGVDFEEHRAYQPGDDIRSIDWRVTARSGRPFVKVFREERERPVIIGLDQSSRMFFGSRVAFKSVIAAEAAAILTWCTVDIGDRVGGVVFGDDKQDLIKPRRSKRSALRLLNMMAEYNQSLVSQNHRQETRGKYLHKALEQIYRITRPGSNVYLISDFADLDGSCWDYLQQLALHNTVICFMVYDTLEENLPLPGVYSITDGDRRATIDTHSRALRDQYQQQFETRVQHLEEQFRKLKITFIPLKTSDRVLEQLERWKHQIH